MSARVIKVDPLADPRWDAYVRAHPRWTVYQLGAWAEILRRAYRFEPGYLALEDGGALRGVLPLLHKKGLVSDARVRSLPVFPAGGPLGDTHADEVALIEAARDAAAASGARALAVISPQDYGADLPQFIADSLPPRWIVQVGEDPDALRAGWRKTSNNLFRSLKKADKAGFAFRDATTGRRDLRRFYALYLRTMRKHRTLPRSLRQLELTRDLLGPGEFRLFVVEREGRLAAGGIFHLFRDTVELIYNGSDDALLDLRPNHALYWGVIRWCAEHGYSAFDFGEASPTTTLGRFKSQWADPVPNHRYTWRAGAMPSRAESIAAASYEMEQGGGGLVAKAWQRTPVGITRLGATIAYRYL
jgi:Acetyltransferase (GNAT) domain